MSGDAKKRVRPQFVYVVTGSEGSRYHWMTLASIASLRHAEPSAKIILLHGNRRGQRGDTAALEDRYGVSVRSRACESDDDAVASRELKVSMRQLVTGDFLYLDSDTWVCRPLWARLPTDVDFSAALDVTGVHRAGEYPAWAADLRARLGWPSNRRDYRNSGVIWWRDTPGAMALGECWRDAWRASLREGVHQDQPALNYAIGAIGPRASVLPPHWNTIAACEPYRVRQAFVLHFFASLGDRPMRSVLDAAVDDLMAGRQPDVASSNERIAAGNAWFDDVTKVRSRAAALYLATMWRAASQDEWSRAWWAVASAMRCSPERSVWRASAGLGAHQVRTMARQLLGQGHVKG